MICRLIRAEQAGIVAQDALMKRDMQTVEHAKNNWHWTWIYCPRAKQERFGIRAPMLLMRQVIWRE